MVYAKPGATVIEIVPEGYDQGVTSCRSVGDYFGLRYVPLFAHEIVASKNRCNSDMAIEIAELVDIVRGIRRVDLDRPIIRRAHSGDAHLADSGLGRF